MNKLIVNELETGVENCLLTQAGYYALITPLPMKEYISNNRKDEDGKHYLTSGSHLDDAIISVQFVAMPNGNVEDTMDRMIEYIKANKLIGTYNVLYKSVTGVTYSNGFLLFSVNVIKLAR